MQSAPQTLVKKTHNDYNIWRSQTEYLYDLIVSSVLTWPSLTCEFFKEVHSFKEHLISVQTQKILVGTQTSTQTVSNLREPNNVHVMELKLPDSSAKHQTYDVDADYEGTTGALGKLRVVQTLNHPTEVHRARIMPQNQNIIATKANNEFVYIFDLLQHPKNPISSDFRCEMKLSGIQGGFGLCWNSLKCGHILSAGEKGNVCVWDTSRPGLGSQEAVKATTSWNLGESPVEHTTWHHTKPNMFGCACANKSVAIFDCRKQKPALEIKDAHKNVVYSIDFNPINPLFYLTGSADRTAALWDVRKSNQRLHTFEGHFDEVYKVSWHPQSELHFQTCSADRKVAIWDVSLIGVEQTPEEAEDGAPELMFLHGGHTNKVGDACWNPSIPWMICSTSDDNILQCWKMAERIYNSDEMDCNLPQDLDLE